MIKAFYRKHSSSRKLRRLFCTVAVVIAVCLISNLSCGADSTVQAFLDLSNRKPFVYESFTMILRVEIDNIRIGREMQLSGFPSSDIWKMDEFRELAPEQRVKEGRNIEIRRYRTQARVLQPGRFNLKPELNISILHPRQTQFGRRTWTQQFRTIQIQSPELNIREIPIENAPQDFSGAVGIFDLNATVYPTNVAAGDLVTINMVISGKGWLENITQPPGISSGRHFRVYAPTPVKVDTDNPNRRVFEQIVVPQNTNAVNIPPVMFSFFNTASGKYETKQSEPFTLQFTRKVTNEVMKVFQPQPDQEQTGQDATGLQWYPFSHKTPSLTQAEKAYLSGNFKHAVELLENYLKEHPNDITARGNLAAALHAAGDHGKTVWHLVNLYYINPRTDHINKNLHAALQSVAGITAGRRDPHEDPRLMFTRREWLLMSTITAVCAVLLLIIPAARRIARPAFAFPVLLVSIFCALIALRINFIYKNEAVVMNSVTARLAPWPDAAEMSKFRPGNLVYVTHDDVSGWILVRCAGHSGWLPRSAVCYLNESPTALRLTK